MEDEQDPTPRVVTLDQVVAWNIAWYRRAAGMKQARLAEHLGWPENRVSEAERAWHGKRTREFNAQLLADLARALGIPLIALLLPPEGERVLLASADGEPLGMPDLMLSLIMPDRTAQTPVMDAYRERLRGAVTRHLNTDWAREVARWLRLMEDREARTDRAARLRSQAEWLAGTRHELLDLAARLEEDDPE
jgi:transcriptional regulator with XRE-family HTH domain